MDKVICACGYDGDQMIEFETHTPNKMLVEWQWGCHYYDAIKQINKYVKTLNWACPKCGSVLVQQRGGLSYDMHERKDMEARLSQNNNKNRRLLRVMRELKTEYDKFYSNSPEAHVTFFEFAQIRKGKHIITKSLKYNSEFNHGSLIKELEA